MGTPAYNAWRVTALTTLPYWGIAFVVLMLAGALWMSARGIASEPSRVRRAILTVLRGLACLLVLGLVLEPGLELRAETGVRARIAVLLDTSKSMRFQAAPAIKDSMLPAASRADEMLAWLTAKSPQLRELASRFQIDLYGFDKDLEPQDLQKLLAIADPKAVERTKNIEALASGPSTDLLGAIDTASRSGSGGRPLAGMIVASDGADNSALSEGMNSSATEQLKKLSAPIFTLAVGAAAQKDLAIERLRVDDFAFVRSPVKLSVRVSARGFGKQTVPLTLKREGQTIAEQVVVLDGKSPYVETEISFVPDRTGKFAFTVSAPVYEGEAIVQNNQKSFVLKVIRDRVRVLQVVGRPSWDERFLRQLLKKDPNVDLISFFILRTPGDDSHSTQDELSLIPFPTNEIFNEQLRTFDLVIFQNFDHRPYRMSQYLDGIAAYIRDGGAFAMIGGDQSFGAGDYTNSAIEEILPVALPFQGEAPVDETPAALKLTDAGKRHPVTELLAGAEQNAALWAGLPKLPGLNRVSAVRPGAQVLLQATDGRPALVVGEAGQGRAMALLTDSSWMWSFVAAGQELGPRAYESFWHDAIRWLVRDPALTPMRLQAQRTTYEPGEPIQLDAQVRGSDYGASAGAQLSVQLFSGAKGAERAFAGPIAGPDGNAVVQIQALPPGAYRAQVTARRPDGQPAGEAEEAFLVAPTGAELQELSPRPDLLDAVALASGGHRITASESLMSLPLRDPQRVEVGQRTTKPLWDTWTVLLALCAVVGTEWVLRRRWGYA